MNLYKVKYQRSNAIDEWIEDKYVVAASFAEIGKNHPNSIGMVLVEKGIEILK